MHDLNFDHDTNLIEPRYCKWYKKINMLEFQHVHKGDLKQFNTI